MPLGRTARLGLGVVGGAGLVIAAGLAVVMAPSEAPEQGRRAVPTAAGAARPAPAAEKAAPAGRAARLAAGEPAALAEAIAAVAAEEAAPTPMDEATAAAWLDDLEGLGVGFAILGPVQRAEAVTFVGDGLRRLAVAPAPGRWSEALTPTLELLTAGMADPSPAVRAGAAEVVGGLWGWSPGLAEPTDAGNEAAAEWKNRLQPPLVALLDDPEAGVRLAGVMALARLPIDAMARPALARLGDEVPAVRMQVLNAFAARRDLLTEEDVLPRLFDPDPAVAMTARLVLRARGLDDELIGLAKLIYHPRAELRASAIPLLEGRDDIDPVVWLMTLSRDADETVRTAALEALGRRDSPDARERVAEMAETDPSPPVRDAAVRLVNDTVPGAIPPPSLPDRFATRGN